MAAKQEKTKMTEAEAKMLSMSAEYERFMGRWSRQLVPSEGSMPTISLEVMVVLRCVRGEAPKAG
jgi:hypothetical protein